MPDAKFVEIYRAENAVEAHLLKGALEAVGISAHITDESAAGMRPNLWWTAPRVLVAEVDAERATLILREHETARKTRSGDTA